MIQISCSRHLIVFVFILIAVADQDVADNYDDFSRTNRQITINLFNVLLQTNRANATNLIISPLATIIILSSFTEFLNQNKTNEILGKLGIKNEPRLLMQDYFPKANEKSLKLNNKVFIPKDKMFRQSVNNVLKQCYNLETENKDLNETNCLMYESILDLTGRLKHNFESIKMKFAISKRQTVTVPAFSTKAWLKYDEDDTTEFLKLPLSHDLYFTFVLPKKHVELSGLNLTNLFKLRKYSQHLIEAYIPQLRLASNLSVKFPLEMSGFQNVFVKQNDSTSLSVQDIHQVNNLDLTNHGKYRNYEGDSLKYYTKVPNISSLATVFNVSKPFIFYVERFDVILLAGVVYNPE